MRSGGLRGAVKLRLWGITFFFNPSRSVLRSENYRVFREASRRQGLPLLAIELAFGDDAFELKPGVDAEILVQKRARSVLWQKERIVNLAVESLPPEAEFVCWIDADLVFDDDDWIAETEALLASNVAVQPFSQIIFLPEGGRVEDFPSREIGRSISRGSHEGHFDDSVAYRLKGWRRKFAGVTGGAWATRRGFLEDVGLYDRCVVGGGDREFSLAIGYRPGRAPLQRVKIHHPPVRAHILDWQRRVHECVGRRFTCRKGVIHHLWHGNRERRQYDDRHKILAEHDFDPETDLVLDEEGCWTWAPGREALASAVERYFDSRDDDG